MHHYQLMEENERLRKRIKELENPWISVDDRLPEEGQLVWMSNYEYLDPSQERFYVSATYVEGEWMDLADDSAYSHADYWAPILEIPKK